MSDTGIRVTTPDAQYTFAKGGMFVTDSSGYMQVSEVTGRPVAIFAPGQWCGAWYHGSAAEDAE